MILIVFAVAVLSALPAWLVSQHFASQLAGRRRVVMQWSLAGKPTSWASPRTALLLTPSVGSASLLLIGVLTVFSVPSEPRPFATLGIVAVGLLIATIHAVHLWFAVRNTSPDERQ